MDRKLIQLELGVTIINHHNGIIVGIVKDSDGVEYIFGYTKKKPTKFERAKKLTYNQKMKILDSLLMELTMSDPGVYNFNAFAISNEDLQEIITEEFVVAKLSGRIEQFWDHKTMETKYV